MRNLLPESYGAIPFMGQYTGPWDIAPDHAAELLHWIRSVNLEAHLSASADTVKARVAAGPAGVQAQDLGDGIYLVRLEGAMTKRPASFSGYPGNAAFEARFREMAADEAVRGVMVVMDSGGGVAQSTGRLAETFRELTQSKPTAVWVEDWCASAAYLVAAQAGSISADRHARVGSIGTIYTVYDWSEANARAGIKAAVLTFGRVKAAGHPDIPLSDEHRAVLQKFIDEYGEEFVRAVALGRRRAEGEILHLATGEVWTAPDAKDNGLIDQVETLSDALARLSRRAKERTRVGSEAALKPVTENPMNPTPEQTAPKAASLEELRAALPKASGDAAFLLECIDHKRSVDQAKDAWIARVEARATAAEQRAATAEQQAAVKGLGHAPVPDEDSDEACAGAAEKWESLVEAEVLKPGMNGDRLKAVQAVHRRHPGLRERMLREVNKATNRPVMI